MWCQPQASVICMMRLVGSAERSPVERDWGRRRPSRLNRETQMSSTEKVESPRKCPSLKLLIPAVKDRAGRWVGPDRVGVVHSS
jgi:hypothetical protein